MARQSRIRLTCRARDIACGVYAGAAALALLLASGCAATGHDSAPLVVAEYWVSPDGRGAACSASAPCKLDAAQTLIRGRTAAMSSDLTVTFTDGTYVLTAPWTLSSALGDSGQNGHRVIYRAAAGATPTLSGGRVISGWAPVAGSALWSAPVAAGVKSRDLYVNDIRRPRAHGFLPGTVTQTATGYDTTASAVAAWRNPTDIEAVWTGSRGSDYPWTEPRCAVSRIVAGLAAATTHLALDAQCYADVSSLLEGRAPTAMENVFELLDEPGEWYLDGRAGIVYYLPAPGEDMTTSRVVMPVLEQLVVGQGTVDAPLANLTISGLTFADATWLGPERAGGWPEQQATLVLTADGWIKPDANVAFHTTHQLHLEGNTFTRLGSAGLDLDRGSSNDVVSGNVFYDISGNGLQLGDLEVNPTDARLQNRGNTISDNAVSSTGRAYQGGTGIWVGFSADTIVAHNEVFDTPFVGITVGWGDTDQNNTYVSSYQGHNEIAFNRVGFVKQVLDDGGAIYVYGPTSGARSSIHDNWVYGDPHPFGALYLDGATTSYDVFNNVVQDLWTDASATGLVNHWVFLQGVVAWQTTSGVMVSDNFTDDATPLIAYDTSTNSVDDSNQLGLTTWPSAAQAIRAAAGLEPAYQNIRGAGQLSVDDAVIGSGSAQFTYVGASWVHCAGSCGPHADLATFSHDPSGTGEVVFRFLGTQVTLYAATTSDGGFGAVSIDLGSEALVDFHSLAGRSAVPVYTSPILPAGAHVLRLRGTASKDTRSQGLAIGVDRVQVTRGQLPAPAAIVDDSLVGSGSNQWSFTGATADSWSAAAGATTPSYPGNFFFYLGNTVHYSNEAAATATLNFVGSAVALRGATDPSGGRANLFVDDRPAGTIDFGATNPVSQVLMWSSPQLSAGAHTLTVKIARDAPGYAFIDYAVVAP